MGGFQFQAKLIAAAMVVAFLLVGDAPGAYAAQFRYGSEMNGKPSPTSSDTGDGWRKMENAGTEGSYGGKSLDIDEGKVEAFRFRSLGSKRRAPSPPPAPVVNKRKSAAKPFIRPLPPPPPPSPYFHQ